MNLIRTSSLALQRTIFLACLLALFQSAGNAQKRPPVHGDHEIAGGIGVIPIRLEHPRESSDADVNKGFYIAYGYKLSPNVTFSGVYSHFHFHAGYNGEPNPYAGIATQTSHNDWLHVFMVKGDFYVSRGKSLAMYMSLGGGVTYHRYTGETQTRDENNVLLKNDVITENAFPPAFQVTLLGFLIGNSTVNGKIELGFGSLGLLQAGLAVRL